MTAKKEAYYYAHGCRVPLVPDDEYVAIDMERAAQAKLPPKAQTHLHETARGGRGDILLVRREDLPTQIYALLENEGAFQPVYRHEGSRLVILPEVRGEDARKGSRVRLREWIKAQKCEAKIVKERGDQVVLRPTSGSGSDALDLANRIHEELAPEMVQVRMIRVVRKP